MNVVNDHRKQVHVGHGVTRADYGKGEWNGQVAQMEEETVGQHRDERARLFCETMMDRTEVGVVRHSARGTPDARP